MNVFEPIALLHMLIVHTSDAAIEQQLFGTVITHTLGYNKITHQDMIPSDTAIKQQSSGTNYNDYILGMQP